MVTRRAFAAGLLAPLASASDVGTTKLDANTRAAFDQYVARREQEIAQRPNKPNFLWAKENRDRWEWVREGAVVEPRGARPIASVGSGLVHDWIGAVFIPGVKVADVVRFVQDYDHHQAVYKPEVLKSRLLSRDGDTFRVYLRLKKSRVVTVVLDTEYLVNYQRLSDTRVQSLSRSTKIVEVDGAGSSSEHARPAGSDHGFLWALNTYWRFEAEGNGVVVECEAVSLSRGIPALLGPMIKPIVKGLPEESLSHTLDQTRYALKA